MLVRKFIYGPGIDEPICMIDVSDSNKKYYYHFDGLGSVVALSDSSANIEERYCYDIFGKPDATSTVGNPYMFTSRRIDLETDNYYYRARYYSPKTGRFLQTDPIGYADSMNLYQYCGNNPVNWIDPFGLKMTEAERRAYLFARARALRRQVGYGEITDLEALARLAEDAADFHSGLFNDNEKAFVDDLSFILTEQVGRWGRGSGHRWIRFGQSGFKRSFQDVGDDSPQVRHFVGFVAAGYYWKMDGATLAIHLNEDNWNFSDPDWQLGWKAAWLGARLKGGPFFNLNLHDVPDWIRENVGD